MADREMWDDLERAEQADGPGPLEEHPEGWHELPDGTMVFVYPSNWDRAQILEQVICDMFGLDDDEAVR